MPDLSTEHSNQKLRPAIFALLALAVSVLSVPTSSGAGSPSKLARAENNRDLLKVSGDLLSIRSSLEAGDSMARALVRHPRIVDQNGLIQIEVRLVQPPTEALTAALQRSRLRVTDIFQKAQTVIGYIAPGDLHQIAALSEVRLIRPVYPPVVMAGAADSQGDASLRAPLARSSFSIDGDGVTVGILSDSFASTASMGGTLQPSNPEVCPTPIASSRLTNASGQNSGDLPADIYILDDCDSISSNCSDVRDEGAALGEVIHDVAPGANQLFHSGFNSRQDFADGIDELGACGADVIVDDVIYLVEPMFQDGLIAQAVQRVADDGVAYFSAAGNQASFGIDESFDDYSGSDEEEDSPSGIDFHDFSGAGDPFASITVPAGCGFTAVLQWNEPFDVPLGPGAATDLDLYVCEGEGGAPPGLPPFHPSADPCQILSQDAQGCGAGVVNGGLGDPVEIVDYLNSGPSSKTVYLAVDHYCGDTNGDFQEDDSVRFRVVTYGYGCNLSDPGYQFESGIFNKPQIYGHSVAAGASSIASVFYTEIDTNGLTDPPFDRIDVEPYSSTGGSVPIYFAGDGSLLPGAPQIRMKPELAAPDGVNTTFFGSDIAGDPDLHPNFFGSSAAAPHAAGLAALMLDANPHLTSDNLAEILTLTARDIESAGWDAQSGHGLIDAFDAVTLSRPVSTVGPSSHQFGVVGVADTVTNIFTLSNDTSGPATLWVSLFDLSDAANFGVDTSKGHTPCGSSTPVLAPGASCTFEVSFTPSATGTYSETLQVLTNGPTAQLSLAGSSIAPALTVTGSAAPTVVSEPGGNATISAQVRNDSAATDPVTINALSDSLLGALNGIGTCSLPQVIQPNATYQCSYAISVAGNAGAVIGRQLTAAGQDDDGEAVNGGDTTAVTVANSSPSLSATLSADPSVIMEPGAWVTLSLEVENVSSSTDPITIQSILEDIAGDLTNGSNPLVEDSSCQIGSVVAPGQTYSCSYRTEVSGRTGQTPSREVTISGEDDENSTASDTGSVLLTVQSAILFEDGFESGDSSAWTSSTP